MLGASELVSGAAEAGVWGRGGEWRERTGRAARGTDCHVLILRVPGSHGRLLSGAA